MQTSLNLSLARVLHVDGDHTGLLADTGITPLQLTSLRYVHLAQLYLRLTISRPNTLAALLFDKLNSSLPFSNLHTSTLDYHIRYATHAFKVDLHTDPLPDMTSQNPTNRERAFRKMMRKIIGDHWKGQLYNTVCTHAGQPPGEKFFIHSNCPRRHATLRSFQISPVFMYPPPQPAPTSSTSNSSHQLHPYPPLS